MPCPTPSSKQKLDARLPKAKSKSCLVNRDILSKVANPSISRKNRLQAIPINCWVGSSEKRVPRYQ